MLCGAVESMRRVVINPLYGWEKEFSRYTLKKEV